MKLFQKIDKDEFAEGVLRSESIEEIEAVQFNQHKLPLLKNQLRKLQNNLRLNRHKNINHFLIRVEI